MWIFVSVAQCDSYIQVDTDRGTGRVLIYVCRISVLLYRVRNADAWDVRTHEPSQRELKIANSTDFRNDRHEGRK